MDMEDHGMSIGWPLGLEVMSSRLTVIESLSAAYAGSWSLLPSTSFSSFTSSALDTESSASFFEDGSKSLGLLTGIRPRTGGQLHFPYSRGYEESELTSINGACPKLSRGQRVNAPKSICIPLLVNIMVRISRNKDKEKRYCS